MRAIRVLVALIIFTVAFTLTSGRAFADPAHERFRVGIILPLSGETSAIGQSIQNGFTLGLEALSPEDASRIQVSFEDDAFDPKRSVSAFQKLLAVDKIQAVVVVGSGTAKAVAPLAEEKKIPMIAIATDPAVSRGRTHVVNFWVTPDEEVRALLPEIRRRGYKTVARISTIHDMNVAVNEIFDREQGGLVNLALSEEYPAEVKDFKPFLNKVRARKDVDAIFALLMPGQLGIFARQAKQFGLNTPLFGVEIFEDPNEIRASEGGLVGGWYAIGGDPKGDFVERYRKRFLEASLFGAGNAHDIIHLIIAGLKRGEGAPGLNTFLHEVRDFNGVLGTFSATGDNRFSLPATLKIVTEKGVERLTP